MTNTATYADGTRLTGPALAAADRAYETLADAIADLGRASDGFYGDITPTYGIPAVTDTTVALTATFDYFFGEDLALDIFALLPIRGDAQVDGNAVTITITIDPDATPSPF